MMIAAARTGIAMRATVAQVDPDLFFVKTLSRPDKSKGVSIHCPDSFIVP
jgi:hypothetical protein